VPTSVGESFYPKILKWQKVSYQEKKHEKVQICQYAPTPLSGGVAFKGFFNSQLSQKYKSLNQRLPFFDIFKHRFCILKKLKVMDGSSNQKRAYKSDVIIFPKCISSLSFRGSTMIHGIVLNMVNIYCKLYISTIM
jgi:hypothetical protein